MEVDWTVGQVMQALERNDLTENTLVIFTADNGAYPGATKALVPLGHDPLVG